MRQFFEIAIDVFLIAGVTYAAILSICEILRRMKR